MIEPPELAEIALAASAADALIVIVEEHSEVNLRWAANAVTTSGFAQTRTVTAIAINERAGGRAIGAVSGTVADAAQARALVRVADQLCREGEVLADSSPLVPAGVAAPDWAAPAPVTSPDRLTPLAREVGSACRAWAAGGRQLFGYAEHLCTTTWLASSTGLRGRFDQPDGRLELTGKSAGGTHSTWAGQHLPNIENADVAGALIELERGLEWGRRRIELAAGAYETVLPPAVVADLMLCLYRALGARDAAEGRSALAGLAAGAQLSALPLTLVSDPGDAAVRCAPFALATAESGLQSVFDNGLPISRTAWIEDGRLAELIRPRTVAGFGSAPRPMVGNLILDGLGTASVAEMVASTERGLLLTSLWYIRNVDPRTLLVTGLTRDGVYLVQDGRVTAAVNNFRFNDSPLDLLRRATEVGRSEHTLPRERSDAFRRTVMAPLRVPDFRMASVSDSL